jgi:hypothetical protein
MDNLMQASTDIEHAKHVQDFTDSAKAIVTKEHLETVCAKYQSEQVSGNSLSKRHISFH